MRDIASHPYFQSLAELHLSPDDFAIAGSGPLFAHGLIDDLGDLDIVCRNEAWTTVCKLGDVIDAPLFNIKRVLLFDETLEFLNGWFPEIWTTDEIIDGADLIQGIRFVPLAVVFKTKSILKRPRDLLHLEILKNSSAGTPALRRKSPTRDPLHRNTKDPGARLRGPSAKP